mmetsp:Transcript_2401/g.3639  ORF Transcript_2401/g.3639 Transcript_2401/m.3639 type:complete len:148 (+) Transcript_2401:314-757(+)
MWRNRVRTQREQYTLLKGGKTSSMTQGHIYTLEELGFVWLLPAQQDKKLEKAIQPSAKKKLEESHVATEIISSAIAASNPEIFDPSAAVAATVTSANLAEVGREITNFAAADLTKNAPVEGIARDEEEILCAYILSCVIPNKMPGIL